MSGAVRSGQRYRFFTDPGHGWLEVPRSEIAASGAQITLYSYYDPATDMVYLEEDLDKWSFLKAIGRDNSAIGEIVHSSMPRRLPAYDTANHVYVVRPGNAEGAR